MRVEGSAPQGAQCAIHVDRPGSLVCARCGSFMCEECSEQGRQAQCPSCRALAGTEAFPYTREDFDLSRLWNHAFEAFKRDALMLCVAVVVFFAIVMAGGMVVNVINTVLIRVTGMNGDPSQPLTMIREFVITLGLSQTVGLVVNLVVQGIAVMGLYRVLMDVLLGKKADLARMFTQLPKLGRYAVANVVLFLVTTLPILLILGAYAMAVVASIGMDVLQNLSMDSVDRLFTPTAVLGLVVILPVILVWALALLPLTLFMPAEIVVSDAPPLEALKRVWAMASGHRLAVIGYSFVVGLLSLVGMLACCVGLIPAMALGYLLTLALFLALRSSSEFPPILQE